DLRQWRTRAMIAGGLGLLLLAVGLVVDRAQFFRSYLWAYMYVLALSLGPLAWLMLQYVTGGAWGVVIRRSCEAAARTLPLTPVLFPADLGRDALPLSVDGSERRCCGRDAAPQAAIPERPIFHRPSRDLLRRLALSLVVLQPLVGARGSGGTQSR